jgi:tetratricopeptide (TPR) repeat protein
MATPVEESRVKSIRPPDLHHLHAAQGWLELGNCHEASEDLEKVSPENRLHPDVLEVRWHINSNAKQWHACLDIAAKLVLVAPERPDSWIHRSFSLHELKRTQEAFDQLLPVAEKFAEDWTVPYNLACYCSRLGRFKEAQQWFEKALAIGGEAVQQAGNGDPDLKPLWDNLGAPRCF